MAENNSLIVQENHLTTVSPAEVVRMAADQAKALMDIVEQQQLFQEIQGKKYLEVEAWETIGAFNNVGALTEYVIPLMESDQIVGYEAKCNLLKHGEIISSAIMSCGLDEFPCQGKQGMAKHKAAKSAAQTWAESKAYRMKYAYVAKLAGYQATPAEEMITDSQQCLIHDAPMKKFTKGRSTWYAHKLEDGKWCNGEVKGMGKDAESQPAQPAADASKEKPCVFAVGTYEEFKKSAQSLAKELKMNAAACTEFLRDNFGVESLKDVPENKRNSVIDMLIVRRH